MLKELDLLQKRFDERRLEIKDAQMEVNGLLGADNELLGADNELLERFYTLFVITIWGCRPEVIKIHQEELKKVKEINDKIKKKSLELYQLLKDMEELSGESQLGIDTPDIFNTLELISEANKLGYKLNPIKSIAISVGKKYQRILEHTVKRLLKKDGGYDYCPGFDHLIYAMYERSNSYVFYTKIERQATPRAMVRAFYTFLIGHVKANYLPEKILEITPDTVSDLTNVALNLSDDDLISSDNVRKVFAEVMRENHGQLNKKNKI